MDVTGRVVLITGASSGVGAALAEQLAGMGARVVVNYSRSADAADAVVSRITSAGGAGTGSAGRRIRRDRLQATGGRDD